MEKIIEVKDVDFAYNDNLIFKGINFTINSGDFVALIGSNGAGKSTLIKLLLGELTAKRGSIEIFGKNPKDYDKWYRVGYVPQHGIQTINNFPASAEEIVQANLFNKIGLLRFPKKVHRQKTQETLDLVGMGGHSKDLIGNLSGGQQQRVLLARALVNDPEVLILDEPTVGVDDATVKSFYRLIKDLNNSLGITILIVTHDIARAHEHITRAFCLEKGTLVELTKEEVKMELKHKHHHPTIETKGDDR